jgi:hypothetical protein
LFLPAILIEFPKRVCCDWKYANNKCNDDFSQNSYFIDNFGSRQLKTTQQQLIIINEICIAVMIERHYDNAVTVNYNLHDD